MSTGFIQRGRQVKVAKLLAKLREHQFTADLVRQLDDKDWLVLCAAAGVNAKRQPSHETKQMVLDALTLNSSPPQSYRGKEGS